MGARLFIRNDDVWTLDKEFCFFFEEAVKRDIPVVHAVIPGKMDQEAVEFLCRAKKKTPQLLDIVQHGWMHKNYSIDGTTKFEFGPLRDLRSQQEDIQLGLKKMREAFGEYFTPAFVPPYHSYDKVTLNVLGEEGFKVFSAGTRWSQKDKRFIEIPAQISFSRYEEGKASIRPAKEVLTEAAKAAVRRPLAGVLTHHKDFAGLGPRRELTRFFDCIAALKKKENWRVLLFSDILSASKGA